MTIDRDGNLDTEVVRGFGEEWNHFDQTTLSPEELQHLFESYFHIFPWDALPSDAEGFDLGCGSGRWARLVAQRVGTLHCIDPSQQALAVARRAIGEGGNVRFHQASAGRIPLAPGSMDFGYSLGVLHHIPDTAAGLAEATSRLKPGAPFLLYLYYAFDNKPAWFRSLWKSTEAFRFLLSRSPFPVRYVGSQLFALLVYFPLARIAGFLASRGRDVSAIPLSEYRHVSLYSMRTDALDRFGTKLEQRFTRDEMRRMMEGAGLRDITFSERAPFWSAVGYKA